MTKARNNMTIVSLVIVILAIGLIVNTGCRTAQADSTVEVEISGKVVTSSTDETTQIGTISMIESVRDGLKLSVEGSIVGKTTSMEPITLDHIMVFPGQGNLFTENDVVTVCEVDPDDPCILFVKETINFVGGTGVFENVIGGSGTATGTINVCTKNNEFEYEAELIYEEQ